jgi:hypothetical protein
VPSTLQALVIHFPCTYIGMKTHFMNWPLESILLSVTFTNFGKKLTLFLKPVFEIKSGHFKSKFLIHSPFFTQLYQKSLNRPQVVISNPCRRCRASLCSRASPSACPTTRRRRFDARRAATWTNARCPFQGQGPILRLWNLQLRSRRCSRLERFKSFIVKNIKARCY